jgi:ribosomal-protein-alanine N-acetyltransferase
MIITFPIQRQLASGARPINLNRDIPQVLELLEIVFGESLRSEGNSAANGVGLDSSLPFLYRFNLGLTRLSPGFVWEENGRIVGNATLLRTKLRGRYLVVNVGVHPNFRRRGIARRLMEAIMEQVRGEGGRFILLQVVKDNDPAIDLYKSLNFRVLGSVTSWYSSVSRVRAIPAAIDETPTLPIRELKGSEWRAAYELDQRCLRPELNWPEPLAVDAYKRNWWRRLSDTFNGRQAETWVTTNAQNELTGMAQILSEWGRLHTVHLRIDPAWWGKLERPLLAKVTRRLKYLGHRNVRLDHIDNHEEMNELLQAANFDPRRTLTHMCLKIG